MKAIYSRWVSILGVSAILLAAAVLANQNTDERIDWQVISGGGTEGSSTSYNLQGTFGQTAIGSGNSATFVIDHGFWQNFEPASCCNKAGDANNDNKVNVGDAVYIISYVFRGGPAPICLAEGNANGDLTPQGANKINVGDAVYIISYVFRGGPAPVCGIGL